MTALLHALAAALLALSGLVLPDAPAPIASSSAPPAAEGDADAPASGVLRLRVQNRGEAHPVTLTVYDGAGREVAQHVTLVGARTEHVARFELPVGKYRFDLGSPLVRDVGWADLSSCASHVVEVGLRLQVDVSGVKASNVPQSCVAR